VTWGLTNRRKQIQAELATLIYECHTQGRLSPEEMMCLLDILAALLDQGDTELANLLRRWASSGMREKDALDINEIIRVTLVNTDWKDAFARAKGLELIRDLVSELEKEKEKG